MKSIFVAVLALFLSGCNLPYRLPSNATNTAKVRFFIPEASRVATNIGVYVLPDGRCSSAKKVRLLGGLQLGGIADKDVDIGMLKDPAIKYESNSFVEIPVVAEQRFSFALAGHHGFQECRLTMSFMPKADKQYEVTYFTDPEKCYVAISEIINRNGKMMLKEDLTGQKSPTTCTAFWN